MMFAFTTMPPTARSRPGRPARAKSDTWSYRASLDRNQICGMTVFMRSFQARTLSLPERPPADADHVHAARRRVRIRRQNFKMVLTASRFKARLETAPLGERAG